jgi:uncharacterized protein RhaS with RHS repeats
MLYNYFRDYDPQLGRYIESDPIGFGGGINTFAYVSGSPLNLVDASGLAEMPVVTLNDSAFVCRAGLCTAELIGGGSGVTLDSKGHIQGVSSTSMNGLTVKELSCKFPLKQQVGVTTVGQIRALGGDVRHTPNANNVNHATISGITAQQAQSLLQPTRNNPNRTGTARALGGIGMASTMLHIFTLDECRSGTTGQCFCALSAEMRGENPANCTSSTRIY